MEQAHVETSVHHFTETVDRLIAAIGASGATLFARIDQHEAARAAGLALRPTVLLIFGNPRGGTPLMDAVPLIALDLPLKLVIWEERSVVYVAFTPLAAIGARYGLDHDQRLDALQHGLAALVAHVT